MDNYEGRKEEYGYTKYPERTSKWKIWLMFLIPALIIFGLVIFAYINFSSTTISDSKIVEGATIELKENKEASFTVGDEEHFVKINSIGLDTVELTIQSEPIKLKIKIGEEREVDINGDGLMDVIVKLVSIENNIPKVYMRRIYEERKQKFEERKNETIQRAREMFSEEDLPELEKSIRNASVNDLKELENIVNNSLNSSVDFRDNSTCIGRWYCGSWSSCVNGKQNRDCSDFNSCGIIQEKPAMERNCTVFTNNDTEECIENWVCENWRNCENGLQKRICKDLNFCGSVLSKPNRERVCENNGDINNTCTENWNCGNWEDCINGLQTRICKDRNNCGSVLNKPDEQKNCALETTDCGSDLNPTNGKLIFESSQFNLKFLYPDNWQVEELEYGLININPELSNNDEYFDIAFLMERGEGSGLEDAIDYSKENLNVFSNYQITNEFESSINCVRSYIIISDISMGVFGDTKKKSVSFVYNNSTYEIRLHAQEDLYLEYLGRFDEIVNSVRFTS